jgi:hemerythrin
VTLFPRLHSNPAKHPYLHEGGESMAVEWDEYLSVGVEKIDDQHKELFRRINVLMEAINEGNGANQLVDAINFLEEYTVTHFSDEEGFMKETSYAGFESHRKEHEKFCRDVIALKNRVMTEGTTKMNVLKTSQAMISWLVQHIMATDKALAAHLRSSWDNKTKEVTP